MDLELLHVDQLRPFEKNPRINDHAVDAVARSIQKFGFNSPIIVGPDNRICAGHTRWKAAKKLDLKEVPVVRVGTLVAEKFLAYNIADNQTARLAFWDDDMLSELLDELGKTGIELCALGFSQDHLEAILSPEMEVDWEAFDKQQELDATKTHALLPIKVPLRDLNLFKKIIEKQLYEQGVENSDFAIASGKLLGIFLGIGECNEQT